MSHAEEHTEETLIHILFSLNDEDSELSIDLLVYSDYRTEEEKEAPVEFR